MLAALHDSMDQKLSVVFSFLQREMMGKKGREPFLKVNLEVLIYLCENPQSSQKLWR